MFDSPSGTSSCPSQAAQKPFTLPFIPELQLRAGDIFEPESKALPVVAGGRWKRSL